MHLSISDEVLLSDIDITGRMKMSQLIESGKKTQLRAHSQSPWHIPTLDYARRFHNQFDIMWEGKDKNLGLLKIAEHFGV